MTVRRLESTEGRVYAVLCEKCWDNHHPPLVPRNASDARLLARNDGWRAPVPKRKKRKPDHCPECRE